MSTSRQTAVRTPTEPSKPTAGAPAERRSAGAAVGDRRRVQRRRAAGQPRPSSRAGGATAAGSVGTHSPDTFGPASPSAGLSDVPPADPLAQLELLQQQLAAVREQLTETQRLATIGTIAAVIAHEFNNLLTPIVSYAQFALTSAESPTPDLPLIRKALGKAYQSSTKAGKICTSMLALARGEAAGFGVVCVQRVVDEALSVLARDPQKDGIALRVQVQPGLTAVGDPVQLEQVLLNLLINARHALMGHGRNGAITVKATAADAPADPDGVGGGTSVSGGAAAGEVKIQVIDNGPGIPERLLPKIFEPFFTTKATAKRGEQKGTGLGLAICREILAHHKGRIEVESAVGRGTTFTLWLPLAGVAASTGATPSHA